MHCLNHPRREAAARCTSCHEVFCRECVTDFHGKMICGECYRQKTEVKAEKKRDWFLLTASLQIICGLALTWFMVWVVGFILTALPSTFHEGTIWQVFRP